MCSTVDFFCSCNQDFQKINEKYVFTVLFGVTECVEFEFDCEYVEWIPIELVTRGELAQLEENESD